MILTRLKFEQDLKKLRAGMIGQDWRSPSKIRESVHRTFVFGEGPKIETKEWYRPYKLIHHLAITQQPILCGDMNHIFMISLRSLEYKFRPVFMFTDISGTLCRPSEVDKSSQPIYSHVGLEIYERQAWVAHDVVLNCSFDTNQIGGLDYQDLSIYKGLWTTDGNNIQENSLPRPYDEYLNYVVRYRTDVFPSNWHGRISNLKGSLIRSIDMTRRQRLYELFQGGILGWLI